LAILRDIADLIGGKVIGNEDLPITGVCTIQNGKLGSITFIAGSKYSKYRHLTKASAIIASDVNFIIDNGILVDDPQSSIIKVLNFFNPPMLTKEGIHDTAIIGTNVNLGESVSIGPYTVIQEDSIIGSNVIIGANNCIGNNVVVGPNTIIKNNVDLYANTLIGKRTIIHSGSVIGADGYGFVTKNDQHIKIPQTGKVSIGNDVEIGANCTIDRGTIDDTIVGDMCKLDNGIQIGHNVSIGRGCLLTAHVTIAGSTSVGEFCAFGGQSGAIDHVKIGDKAILACYTVAMKDLPGGKTYSGSPAREIKEKNRRDAVFIEVNRLKKRIKELELKFN
tara:strand:+ start:128 stop:1129 length:1002 start_codon:yes stop_codon:yes gene_type:complete